ncbi:winged helix-turn-helix domain-containing protein [Enterococcus alishanensis]|uniref:Helix-turn-helix domain-containing protein n=1 Tax=Enterococcus alishanensis TaxID=1303817 RepID=A0ABS6TFQ5_9ENTE|nr:helix-turn-helix domain-containing protein [Enterococcus alishanensis]MBV7391736.1 helix-turn-helix domain-containing protein [Enterococcus alishanensis]
MSRILYLTRNVYAEQQLESRIRKLGHEVLCSQTLLKEIRNKKVSQNFFTEFEVVLLSDTLTKSDSENILPEISQQEPLIIKIIETEEEVSQQSQIQIYLSPETSLETIREVLSVEKKEDPQKEPQKEHKLLNPSLWEWRDELIFQKVTFTRVEQNILKELLKAEGEPLTPRELAHLVWGTEYRPAIQSHLSATVGRMKKKIRDCGFGSAYLQTVWGKGYAFKLEQQD